MATRVSYPDSPIVFPNNAAAGDGNGTWDFDVKEIKKLAKRFKLNFPVVFKYAGRAVTVYGTHRFRVIEEKFFHSITVCQYLDPEQANRTILHEMRHAFQAERHLEKGGTKKTWNSERATDNPRREADAENCENLQIRVVY